MTYRQRAVAFGFLLAAALHCPSQVLALAQTQQIRIDISANVTGAAVYIDGIRVNTPAVLHWAVGTKHTLAADLVQENQGLQARYRFSRWSASSPLPNPESETIEIVAGTANSTIRVEFATEYLLSINVNPCLQIRPDCSSAGMVFLNGTPYSARGDVYMPAGTVLSLRAQPHADHVFSHWNLSPGGVKETENITVMLDRGVIATPEFKPASAVTILTEPSGLKVVVDGSEAVAPVTRNWAWFSEHAVAIAPAQQDEKGNWWVFDYWSDGGAPSHTVTLRGGAVPKTLVARFVRGTRVELGTDPPGLVLKIDNKDCRECVQFWRIGERHVISAAREQIDRQGLSFRFREWNDGNAGPLVFTTPEVPEWNRVRISGKFDPLGIIKVDSNPQGIPVQVGGKECGTPCKVQEQLGTTLSISPPPTFNNTHDTRLEFVRWADSEARSRSIIASADSQEVTANYRVMSRLALIADPPNSATFDTTPASPDGYYEGNARVSVTAVPRPGHRFLRWEGDVSGAVASGVVNMGGPRKALARFERVPYLDENAVRSAATDIHGSEVSPCSAISMMGVHLAPRVESSFSRPLPQSIAGVTVFLDGRLIPLYFVSPNQINAQMPCDLEEGVRVVTVRLSSALEATTKVRVIRNAPGLFTRPDGDRIYAVATRDDGTWITSEYPVKPGEYVTLYGTGFGPFRRALPEGFAASGWSGYETLDSVEVMDSDSLVAPVAAGAAPNQPGVVYVRFKLGDPSSRIKVRVNGRESNSVVLPSSQ